jgi:ankyrin repeat protein
MDQSAVFFEAINKGDARQVKMLLEQDSNLARSRAPGGESAALWAVYTGHADLVESLMEAGLELDLFEAAAAGKTTRVLYILQNTPDQVNAYAPDGFTALGLAAFFGHEMLVKTLLTRGAEVNQRSRNGLGVQPLHSSVANRQLAISEALLAAGAEVNSPQQEDITPLHEAAGNGQLDMIRLLLHYRADPKAKTRDGKTALDMAADKGHQAVVKFLQAQPS